MTLSLLLFLAGIALLWFSSEIIVRNVPAIAQRLGVDELTVTILGVSVFSSLPELSVSMLAGAQGNPDVSIGNIIGSNFVTLTLVTAVCALISPIRMQSEIRDRESSWMILSTVIILILAGDGVLSRIDGAVLVAMYVPYLFSVLHTMRRDRPVVPQQQGAIQTALPPLWKAICLEIAGVAGVILGAELSLRHGQALAARLGVSDLVLGAVVFAFGTSLPEMAIAVAATLKKRASVSMGEIYSSNIFTALAILGLCCLVYPLTISDPRIISVDIPFLILAGVIVQVFITTGLVMNRIEAVAVLALYGYFVLVHLKPGLVPFHF